MPLSIYRVKMPPAKPLVLFDGECRFCQHWAGQWKTDYATRLDVESSQQAGLRFPELPAAELDSAMQLIEPDGTVYSGAAAVLRARAHGRGRPGFFLRLYRSVPGLAALFEFGYRVVARNRRLLSFFMGGTRPL